MKKGRKVVVFLFILNTIFTNCSSENEKQIKIAGFIRKGDSINIIFSERDSQKIIGNCNYIIVGCPCGERCT